MTTLFYKPQSRGVRYRAPRLRVYRAAGVGNSDGSVSWADTRYEAGLVPLQLHWAANGKLSTLTLKHVLGCGPGQDRRRPERIHSPAIGDRIVLEESGGGRGNRRQWFCGYIAQQELLAQSQPDIEEITLTAYGPEIRLQALVVTGAWYKTPAADAAELAEPDASQRVRSNTFATFGRTVFNKAGRPNASADTWQLTDKTLAGGGYTASGSASGCRVFEPPGRSVPAHGDSSGMEARHWTAYAALRSLVEYFDNYEVISYRRTNWAAVEAMLGNAPIGTVSVTGMNMLDAMAAVLAPVGFGFAIEPWAGSDGRHRLIIFDPRNGRTTQMPAMAPVTGGQVDAASSQGQRAQVQKLHFVRDNHNVVNDVTVVGDRKCSQVSLEFHGNKGTRDLHAFWDTSEHGLAYYADENDLVGGTAWKYAFSRQNFLNKYGTWGQSNHDVFRSFAWNEDGAFSEVIQDDEGKGLLPDLSAYGIGAGGNYIVRPRPVGPVPARITEAGTGQLAAHVELGIVNVAGTWIKIPARIWPDRAGFTISVTSLHDWRPYHDNETVADTYRSLTYLTLLHNALRYVPSSPHGEPVLRLRLSGSIEHDETVVGLAPRQANSSWPLKSQKLVFLPDRFRHGGGDEVELAGAYAAAVRGASEGAEGHGSIVLRGIHRTCRIGDGVPGTSDRNINLQVSADSGTGAAGRAPVVIAVSWDFRDGANKTELLLDSSAL